MVVVVVAGGGPEEEEGEGGRARKAEMREMVYSVTWVRSSRPAVQRMDVLAGGAGGKERTEPSIKSSGSSGESAINRPPKPHPISATVTGLISGLVVAGAISFPVSFSAAASGTFLSSSGTI